MNIIHICILQLLGRAGRNGNQSCGVIFNKKTDLDKCHDLQLKNLCSCKECHRKVLVEALGSKEVLPQATLCCDVCSKENIPTLMELIRPQPSLKKCAKSQTVRIVNEATKKTLMDRLLQERHTIVSTNFGYRMLGKEVVLPTKCLQMICKKARYINSENDIRVAGLREHFVHRLFAVVMDTLS